MIGGGSGTPRPGEVSLAHNGVLFLDELPEFPRNVLEKLRQPLEGVCVTLARAHMTLSFPADFMLIARDESVPVRLFLRSDTRMPLHGCDYPALPEQSERAAARPHRLHIEVPAVAYKELRGKDAGVGSAEMRDRVHAARAIQHAAVSITRSIPSRQLRKVCALDDAGERTLEMAVRRMGLRARAHDRILKVARTIADLGGSEALLAKHVAEAIQYRSLDRSYWS